ncbi:hypothetical protein EPYR_02565 [Erwinia pyrifoliae DSM 12163]|nr:hypothetical protein EPYR_02565 [Erwinia pyrifoliae DSM 12163]
MEGAILADYQPACRAGPRCGKGNCLKTARGLTANPRHGALQGTSMNYPAQ